MSVTEMPSTQFPKEERHDIKETFADSLGQCFFDGQTLRLELCSTRLDEAKPPPTKPTGKRHVVARIVLTPRGAVELLNTCNQIAGAFKQAGILKEIPAQTTGLRPRNRPTTTSNGRWRACWVALTRNPPSGRVRSWQAVALTRSTPPASWYGRSSVLLSSHSLIHQCMCPLRLASPG